jgi:hypothetical protein
MRSRYYVATGVLAVLVVGACTHSSGGGSDSAAGGEAVNGLAPGVAHGAAIAAPDEQYDLGRRSAVGDAGGALTSSGGKAQTTNTSLPLVDGTYKIRTARMTVAVKGAANVAAKANEAVTIAEGVGGEVDSDDRTSGPHATAAMLLRVPPDALDDTLTALSGLGAEKSRSSSTTDVTQKVADVSSRTATARQSIAQLRVLFNSATKVSDLIQLEGELSRREADLESLEAQQRALSRQTSMASITLSLVTAVKAVAAPKPEHKKHENGFVTGLKRGWHGFSAAAAWIAQAVATLLPFIVLLLVLGFALRALRPRLPRLPRRSEPTPVPAE